jgi:hypothetical protein
LPLAMDMFVHGRWITFMRQDEQDEPNSLVNYYTGRAEVLITRCMGRYSTIGCYTNPICIRTLDSIRVVTISESVVELASLEEGESMDIMFLPKWAKQPIWIRFRHENSP